MAGAVPNIELSDGRKMPLVGLGTWQGSRDNDDAVVGQRILLGIEEGYRLIDTAQMYNTEGGVGCGVQAAIDKGIIKREDLFITTKVWPSHHRRADVVRHLRKSLVRLGLDYVDLYLVHWPCAIQTCEEEIVPDDGKAVYEDIDYLETWQGMEDAVDQGLAKSIGVSNFNKKQLERLVANCRIKPVNNQVEANLGFQNLKLIEFCQSIGVSVTAYRSMLYFNEMEGPTAPSVEVVRRIASKHGKTAQQVAQKYQVQRGVAIIPKSSKAERLRENKDLFDFELTEEEMSALKNLDTNKRSLDFLFRDAKEYPFNDEY